MRRPIPRLLNAVLLCLSITAVASLVNMAPVAALAQLTGVLEAEQSSPTPPETKGQISSGTGFIISSTYIATNYHVIRDASRIELKIPGQTAAIVATVVVKDIINDLAILKPDRLPADSVAITFAESPAKVGQDTFTIGYPLGNLMGSTPRLSAGAINSLFGPDDDPRVYQISNPIQPGNSGGPLFNADGQVVAIVVSSLNADVLYQRAKILPQNVNFAIKASFLKNLLDTLPSSGGAPTQNALKGVSRDRQFEALTSSVVEIMNYRQSGSGGAVPAAVALPVRARCRDGSYRLDTADDTCRNGGGVARWLPGTSGLSEGVGIEGLAPDEVRRVLGEPASVDVDNSGRGVFWRYNTPSGPLNVYFSDGKATVRRP